MHRTSEWKYVHNGDDEAPELYDLRNDPREIVNLAGRPERANRVEAARAEFLEWKGRDVVEPIGITAPRKSGARLRSGRRGE